MRSHGALRALAWKDTRLVLPLVLMLPAVMFFLLVLWMIFPVRGSLSGAVGRSLPILLPALFAAGAGAILVGQEKEQRTLWWMAALPIPPRRMIGVKLAVALVGLVAMWLGALVLATIVGDAVPPSGLALPSITQPWSSEGAFWILHSVFILFSGFLTAWAFRNVFVSLLAIVPLAYLPRGLVQVWLAIAGPEHAGYGSLTDGAPVASLVIAAVSIAVTAWLAWRVARVRLEPARPPRPARWQRVRWQEAWRPGRAAPVQVEPFRLSLSALVWQSLHHHRGALAALVAAIVIGAVSLALIGRAEWLDDYGALFGWGVALGLLAVSWLGVLAFTGDGSAERLRFLADRGVSPTTCWLGRHLLSVAAISFAALLYGWLSLGVVATEQPEETLVPSVATVAIVLAVVYAFSQAISHWIRILAASAFLAPVLSAVAVWWLAFAAAAMGAPLWLLLLTAALPLVATWLTMRTYMDGNRWWPIVAVAGAVVLLVIALPAVPLAVRVARFPAMPDKVRRDLTVQAAERWATAPTPVPVMLAASDEDDDFFRVGPMPVEKALEQTDSRPEDPADRFSWLGSEGTDASAAVTVEVFVLQQMMEGATGAKLHADSTGGDEAAMRLLMPWVEHLTQLAVRLRRSPSWDDQEAADVVEIWLTQTLSDSALEWNRDSNAYRSAVDLLSDRQSRNAARRRAVLASWHAFRQLSTWDHVPTTTGFPLGHAYWARPSVERMLLVDHYGDALVGAAVELLARIAAGEPTEPARRRLHEILVGDQFAFETGPYSERLRGDETLPPSISTRQTLRYPANQWGAGWEHVAASLAPAQNLNRQP